MTENDMRFLEADLGSNSAFIEKYKERISIPYGMPMMSDQMPQPREKVGIDGGCIQVRARETSKAGWFEVIIGKGMPEAGANKSFAFVQRHEDNSKPGLLVVPFIGFRVVASPF